MGQAGAVSGRSGQKQQFYDEDVDLKLANSARGSQGQSNAARSSQGGLWAVNMNSGMSMLM